MSITTYAELQTAIQNWLARDDTTTTNRITEFIDLAESAINNVLRVNPMMTRLSVTIDDEYEAQPSDWLSTHSLQITSGGVEYPVNLRLNDYINRLHNLNQSDRPIYYAIVGSDFRYWPKPDTTYTGTLVYKQKVPALTDSATTNWLLTNYPDIYLWMSMAEAFQFLKDFDSAAQARERGLSAMRELTRASRRDQHSGAPLVMSTY
jgi:hypothetical protein